MARSARGRGSGTVDDFLQAAVLHHHHAVGEQHRFVEIVGDEEDGLFGAVMDVQQLALQGLARLRIERAERLVHQQHFRIDCQCARYADALLHAARELVRPTFDAVGKTDQRQIFHRGVVQRRAAHALHFEAEFHVLQGA